MPSYITDLGNTIGAVGGYPELKNSTSRKRDPSELDMTDFLNLMVVQLQNQSIDNTMDTSDMLNQMVQMQMITALANMTDASVMSYASSLVGKEVTIGDYSSGELVEKVVTITGSGVSNGKNVLFAGDEMYDLSSVMAVGRLPSKDKDDKEDEDDKVEDSDKTESTDKTESGGKTESTDKTDTTGKTESTDKTDTTGKTESTDKTESGGKTESTDKTDTTGKTEDTDKTDATGGMEQAGTASRRLTDDEVETLKALLRQNGVEITEDTTNAELADLVNGILRSGQYSGKDTASKEDARDSAVQEAGSKEPVNTELVQAQEEILKDSQSKPENSFSETDQIKALEELLKAQQAQNSANAGQRGGTQARARRIQEIELEEFI